MHVCVWVGGCVRVNVCVGRPAVAVAQGDYLALRVKVDVEQVQRSINFT